jgi:pSer/pThr/pTyr-binding forkhead associated (FHA) protein
VRSVSPPVMNQPVIEPVPQTPPDVLATLTVLYSDDTNLQHQVLNITLPKVQLGRSTQNDIIFPQDTPVSRHHAVIEQTGSQFWMSEVISSDETGSPKRPKFGTFVNEMKMEDQPVLLKSGDVIRLGPRVRLAFYAPEPVEAGDALTIDALRTNDTVDEMEMQKPHFEASKINQQVEPAAKAPEPEIQAPHSEGEAPAPAEQTVIEYPQLIAEPDSSTPSLDHSDENDSAPEPGEATVLEFSQLDREAGLDATVIEFEDQVQRDGQKEEPDESDTSENTIHTEPG